MKRVGPCGLLSQYQLIANGTKTRLNMLALPPDFMAPSTGSNGIGWELKGGTDLAVKKKKARYTAEPTYEEKKQHVFFCQKQHV
jgi:hypothetical protein